LSVHSLPGPMEYPARMIWSAWLIWCPTSADAMLAPQAPVAIAGLVTIGAVMMRPQARVNEAAGRECEAHPIILRIPAGRLP
jgi:hypothetical protein